MDQASGLVDVAPAELSDLLCGELMVNASDGVGWEVCIL